MTLIIFCCICANRIKDRFKDAVLTKNISYMCNKCNTDGNNPPPLYQYYGGIAYKKKEKEKFKVIRYYF